MGKGFKYRFENILRLKKFDLESALVEEGVTRGKREKVHKEIEEKKTEIRGVTEFLEGNPLELIKKGTLKVYQAYLKNLQGELSAIQTLLLEIEKELLKNRQRVVLCHREVLKFERLEELDLELFKKTLSIRETRIMDEIAQTLNTRKEKEKGGKNGTRSPQSG